MKIRPTALCSVMFTLVLAGALGGCGGVADADRLYEQKQYAQAIDAYQAVYEEFRRDARVNYRVGRSFYAMARYDKAEKFLRRAIEAGAKEPDVLWRLAECQDRQKMYVDAAKTFQRVLNADPRNPAALNNLAVMQLQLDEFETAQGNLEKALSIAPDDPEALFNMGLVYERHHRDDEKAADYFARFRARAPDAAQAGEVRDWLRRYEAERSTQRATSRPRPVEPAAISPIDAPDVSEEITARPTRRAAVFDSAAPAPAPTPRRESPIFGTGRPSVAPDDPLSPDLFRGLVDAEDYATVLRRFKDEVRKSDPDYGRYAFYTGLAELEQKNPPGAVALLTDAAKRHPDEPEFLLQLGWAHHSAGDGEVARKLWEDGRTRFPEHRDDFQRALEALP